MQVSKLSKVLSNINKPHFLSPLFFALVTDRGDGNGIDLSMPIRFYTGKIAYKNSCEMSPGNKVAATTEILCSCLCPNATEQPLYFF